MAKVKVFISATDAGINTVAGNIPDTRTMTLAPRTFFPAQ